MERYLGATYSNSYQPAIMTETPETFPDTYMPIIIPDMGVERPKTDAEITYPKNKNTNEAIRHKLRKKEVYETYMHNIYNIIVVQPNNQIQEKAASDATFQAVKTGRENIGYLKILKKLCFSNQS